MNYQLHYNKLIETRKLRVLVKGDYYENHHVLMKSMGGTDDPENLVKLTPREHFLAHALLWRIYRNAVTAHAFNCMRMFNAGQKRQKLSSRQFEILREAASFAMSEFNVKRWKDLDFCKKHSKWLATYNREFWETHVHPRTGKTWEIFLGKEKADIASTKLSQHASTRIREKNSFFGKHHSEENRKKWSERMQGNKPGNSLALYIGEDFYESFTQASKMTKLAVTTIRHRCKSKNPKFSHYRTISKRH